MFTPFYFVFGVRRVNKYKLLICASTNAIYTFDTYIKISKFIIESSEDIHTYQVVWDKEWNCYPDTGELEKNGKKLAYAGEIMTGMKDQMKEIAVVIFDYGTSTDHGSEIFHIFTEQYVKP